MHRSSKLQRGNHARSTGTVTARACAKARPLLPRKSSLSPSLSPRLVLIIRGCSLARSISPSPRTRVGVGSWPAWAKSGDPGHGSNPSRLSCSEVVVLASSWRAHGWWMDGRIHGSLSTRARVCKARTEMFRPCHLQCHHPSPLCCMLVY